MTSDTRNARGGTLVLGGGFAGAYVARRLGRRGATIVNPSNFMLYTPLLPEAAAGSIEPRHVTVPLRTMCPHSDLLLGSAVSLDADAKLVHVSSEAGSFSVGYERLVIALGSITRTPPVPGLAEHALTLKGIGDAIRLRNHVLRRIELADAAPESAARHLTFVFAGAGFAGVEAVAELQELADGALRRHPRLAGIRPRWVLVDTAPRILGQAPDSLARFAARTLGRRGVEILSGTALESIDRSGAVLSDGRRIETETVVWTAGVAANPVAARLGLPHDARGRVPVDELLRVDGLDGIWALGDVAAVPNLATPGRFDPPTCQHALRQAKALARNLSGRERPYRYKSLGSMATLGRRHGIATIGGIRLRGLPGWWVARGYHLLALPFVSRRMRVLADWTHAALFRRDVADLTGGGVMRARRELALFAAAYLLYNAGRGLTSGDMDLALANAQWVLDIQGGNAIERGVQDTLGGVWMTLLSHVYLAAQIVVLPAVLVAMYRWAPRIYPPLRNTVIATWMLSLPIYALFPVAPPRLAGIGMTDAVSETSAVALAGHSTMFYNPIAAVPSLHCGFAMALGIAVAAAVKTRWVQALALAWGPLVALSTVATANHYLFDVAAGLAITLVGYLAVTWRPWVVRPLAVAT